MQEEHPKHSTHWSLVKLDCPAEQVTDMLQNPSCRLLCPGGAWCVQMQENETRG